MEKLTQEQEELLKKAKEILAQDELLKDAIIVFEIGAPRPRGN